MGNKIDDKIKKIILIAVYYEKYTKNFNGNTYFMHSELYISKKRKENVFFIGLNGASEGILACLKNFLY